jgi:hypothetical protein
LILFTKLVPLLTKQLQKRNVLLVLVLVRRGSESEKLERELMAFCRSQAGIDDNNAQHEQEGHSDSNAVEGTGALLVEAAWD